MRQFKDAAGREWSLSVNVATIKRTRELAKIDLSKLFEKDMAPLHALLKDSVKFAEVLWALVIREAQPIGVSEDDFGAALAGDALAGATDSFLEELIDFFPKNQADCLRAVFAEVRSANREAERQLLEILESMDGAAMADEEIEAINAAAHAEQIERNMP